MSKLKKTTNQMRVGDDWRENFKYLNYTNVEASLRAILTATEPKKVYDRFGKVSGTGLVRNAPLSLDETIFRIAVLMESQLKDFSTTPSLTTVCEVDNCRVHAPNNKLKEGEL